MTWFSPFSEFAAILFVTAPLVYLSYVVFFRPITFARWVGYRTDPYANWNRFAFALLALFALIIVLMEFGRLARSF